MSSGISFFTKRELGMNKLQLQSVLYLSLLYSSTEFTYILLINFKNFDTEKQLTAAIMNESAVTEISCTDSLPSYHNLCHTLPIPTVKLLMKTCIITEVFVSMKSF